MEAKLIEKNSTNNNNIHPNKSNISTTNDSKFEINYLTPNFNNNKNYKINQRNNNNNNPETNTDLVTILEHIIIKSDKFNTIQREKLFISFMLFFLVLYFFSSLTLLIANCQPMEIIDTKYNVPFHMIDFWGSFLFTLVEACILVNANMLTIGSLRFLIVAFNIGMTLVAAVLFSMNPEFWEIPCHWIEFSAQICIAFSDLIFIFHQFKKTDSMLYRYRNCEAAMILFLVLGNCFKLLIFGGVIKVGMDGEQAANFIEYIAEMINSVFAFLFTIVSYRECDENLKHLFIKKNFSNLENENENENENLSQNVTDFAI